MLAVKKNSNNREEIKYRNFNYFSYLFALGNFYQLGMNPFDPFVVHSYSLF